jgi:hypothetical protein
MFWVLPRLPRGCGDGVTLDGVLFVGVVQTTGSSDVSCGNQVMNCSGWVAAMLAAQCLGSLAAVPIRLGVGRNIVAQGEGQVVARVSAFGADRQVAFVAFGAGRSLRWIEADRASGMGSTDTVRASTPATLTADVSLGDLRLVSLVDSVRLNVEVLLPGGAGRISATAARIVVKRRGRKIEVSGERP